MKIGGVDPKSLEAEEILVLPKGNSFLVFKAKGLQDMDEFNKFCPEPTPPGKLTREGWLPDPTDKNYQTVLTEYNKRRLAYMIVKTIEPSQIEWETVDVNNPGTWANWEQDLRNAGLSQVEANRVVGLVLEANCLDENKLKKARDLFLQGPRQDALPSTSPTQEPGTSPSGDPVNA